VATKLPSVSAQFEIMPQGTLNITLVRVAPSGGVLTSISSYRIRLSKPKSTGSGVDTLQFTLTPSSTVETTIQQQKSWESILTGSTIPADSVAGWVADSYQATGLSANIQAVSGDPANFIDSDWWGSDRVFPPVFNIILSRPTLQVGDTAIFSLPVGYTGEQLSRVRFFPDLSDMSAATEWKSYIPEIEFEYVYRFSGSAQVLLTVASDNHSASQGSSFLLRTASSTLTINSAPIYSQTGFNSWLGVGDSTGFSFTDTSTNYTPGNFAVILSGAAISTRNRELKMFLATSRTADANTYYQTLAWDLYPVPGRYKIPSFNPNVNLTFDATRAYTDASLYAPLKLTSMLLSKLQVGYHYDIALDTTGGLKPYAYYAVDLPPGLVCTAQGRLVGSPLRSGLYQSSVSVMDSEVPPQIDVKTLNLYVETDLSINDVPFQYYAIGDSISTVITATGGVPPYKWQINEGGQDLADFGLTFTPDLTQSQISGEPFDHGTHHIPYKFPVTIQAEDAVGSLATVTFQCGVFPPALKLAKKRLDEFFDGEYCNQRIYATGGDTIHYNWSLQYLDGPRDPLDATRILTPPTGLITLTPTGSIGAPNIAILSYDPSAVVRGSSGDGLPEAFYKIRITVQSGEAGYIETDYQDLDLIISPSLSTVVISNDAQLPIAYPGRSWSQQLNTFTPDSSVAVGLRSPLKFFAMSPTSDLGLPSCITLSPEGLLMENPYEPITPNLNRWFRIFLQAGRSQYFKDFHFQSADVSTGFSIHVAEAYPFQDSNVVAIAQQYQTLCLQNNDKCIAFQLLNASTGRVVNDVATFSLEGSLPAGLSFSSQGFIYGIPTEKGSFTFTVSGSAGAVSASYAASILVNPAAAYATDLTHDLRFALNSQPSTSLTRVLIEHWAANTLPEYDPNTSILGPFPTSPVDSYAYGDTVQVEVFVDDPDRPLVDFPIDPLHSDADYDSNAVESWSYLWDFGGLPTESFPDASGGVTQINQDYTSKTPVLNMLNNSRAGQTYTVSVVATDLLGMASDASVVTFNVDTSWMKTSSYTFDTTGVHAPDESLTDGDGSTHIDLIGS